MSARFKPYRYRAEGSGGIGWLIASAEYLERLELTECDDFRRRSLDASIATRAGAMRRLWQETRLETKLAVRLPQSRRFTRQRIKLCPTR